MQGKVLQMIGKYMRTRDEMFRQNEEHPNMYSEAEIEWVDSFIYNLYKLLGEVEGA